MRPGGTATLQVRGRGRVALTLDPGTDERKPLFSLFVTRGDDPAARQWVGWSPEGPYDTGDVARGERYIGWQRNTGRPDAPVSFSLAERYHREYYREGILRHLVERGTLTAALEDWRDEPAPRPVVSLWGDELGADPPLGGAGNLLLRQAPGDLRAAVGGIPHAQRRGGAWAVYGGTR